MIIEVYYVHFALIYPKLLDFTRTEVLSLTGLQLKMLELVLEIDHICRKHNITYYLAGGSVLGAVRHRGYIPWDDDIDIMMTRREYARFVKACETEMAEDREIITMINTPCHTKVTIKYMNKSTSQFFRSQVLDTTGCGISLDIFILDPLPRDKKKREQHIAEYIVYNELLTPFFMVNEYLYKHVSLYNRCYLEAKIRGKDKVMNRLYKRLFEDEPAESDEYLYRWGQQLLIYDRSLFGKPRYLEFEGHKLPVPEKTLDFLRATYGDNWIYLPPVQQRETHVANLSTTVAYRNWLKDIAPFLDRPRVLKDFVIRKKHNVRKAIPAHNVAVSNLRQSAALMELEFENDPECTAEALLLLDDQALLDKVSPYLKLQLSGDYIKNQIYANVPDNKLALILNALLRTGEFAKAAKLLRVRDMMNRPYATEIVAAQEQLASVRSMVRYMEDRRLCAKDTVDIRKMGPQLLKLLQLYPQQVNLHRCVLEMYTILNEYPHARINTAIDNALACAPEDPEIAFWAGCLYEMMGNKNEAEMHFSRAQSTTNGVILQRLTDMGRKN